MSDQQPTEQADEIVDAELVAVYARELRAARAWHPESAMVPAVHALSLIRSKVAYPTLSDANFRSDIAAIVAALDLVEGDAARELAATVALIEQGR